MSNEVKNIVRNEYNGCIVYNYDKKKYIFGDFLILDILKGVNDEKLIQLHDSTIDEINELKRDLKKFGVNSGNVKFLNNACTDHQLSAPLRVFLDYTFQCNLRCKHCFTDSGLEKQDELNLNQKKSIIDQMLQMGSYRISLAGGEPLIRKDFFEFVEYARDRNVDVSFTTNGTLFTKSNIEKMNNYGIKTVTVSLDGATAQSHDYIRGQGRFQETVGKLQLLRANYNGKIALRMTMMKTNWTETKAFIDLAQKLGCNSVKFNCIRPTGRAELNKELLLSREEYIQIVKEGVKYNSKNDIEVVLPLNPYDGCQNDYIEDLGFGCVAGKDSMTIFPSGQVKACSQLDEDFVAGNAKTDRLHDLWLHSDKFNFFRTMPGNPTCKSCSIYDNCRGGCRYRALKTYGDINEVDPFCFANAQKRLEAVGNER